MIKCNCSEKTSHCCGVVSVILATAAFMVVLLKNSSELLTWITDTNVWWFVAAFVIFAVKAKMCHDGGVCAVKPVKKAAKKTAKKAKKKKK